MSDTNDIQLYKAVRFGLVSTATAGKGILLNNAPHVFPLTRKHRSCMMRSCVGRE